MSCMNAERPQLPSDFEAVTWLKLEDAIRAVHEKRAVSSSLEELYRVRASQCHTLTACPCDGWPCKAVPKP